MNYFNYFTEVEETFVRRRGQNLLISSKDWDLINQWKDRGVPLHIAIRAIESVFDNRNGNGKVSTLGYCARAVDEQYAEWLTSQVGNSGTEVSVFGQDEVENHIVSAIEKLMLVNRPEIREEIQRAIQRLTDLATTTLTDLDVVDRSLGDIEMMLDAAMLTKWDPQEFEQIEQKVHRQLEAYKEQMDEDSYSNTATLMLLKSLREASGIPRLGVFYL